MMGSQCMVHFLGTSKPQNSDPESLVLVGYFLISLGIACVLTLVFEKKKQALKG